MRAVPVKKKTGTVYRVVRVFKAGPEKYIVVNRHVIAANKKNKTDNPVMSVRQGRSGQPSYGHRVHIFGEQMFDTQPRRPLKCGATVWAVTTGHVTVIKR